MARAATHAMTLAALCVLSNLVHAGAITVAPVVVEIDSPRKATAVTVSNGTGRPLTIQTDTRAWRQVNGQDVFEPTQDVLAVPPMAVIPPGATQVFRVALRHPAPSNSERTYRLILEDVAQVQPDGSVGVAFRYAHNLPVLVAPTGGVRTAMRYEPCEGESHGRDAAPSHSCVRLTNVGNKRVKIESLAFSGSGWQETHRLAKPQNILAGASREWLVPVQPGAMAAVRAVQVHTAQGVVLDAAASGQVHARGAGHDPR